MTKTNKTKAMLEKLNRYEQSKTVDLWQAYATASENKRRAWRYCQGLCGGYNGWGLKIIGANCHQFSAGFLFQDGDGVVNFAYITKSADKYCEV